MNAKTKILIAIFTLILLVTLAVADIPPPPVNQNFGMYDTAAINYSEIICRGCHNSTSNPLTGGVPTRHHNLVVNSVTNPATNQPFQCTDCHPSIPSLGNAILLDRNCMNCHNRTAFWGNSVGARVGGFTGPHHNTTQAQVRDCKFCHGASVDNYNDGHYIPSNPPDNMTPSATYKIFNRTSGRVWEGCFACHAENASASPPIFFTQMIPNPVDGKYSSAPVPTGANNVHHLEIIAVNNPPGVYPGDECTWCHPDMYDVIAIRGCESCHSVRSIHNIQYDFANTSTKLGYGHIGSNNSSDSANHSWDCKGCHAYNEGDVSPFAGSIIPDIRSVTPTVFEFNTPTVLTLTGTNFVQTGSTTFVNIDDTTNLIPDTIINGQITVTVNLAEGNHYIKVVKTDSVENLPKPSNIRPMTVISKVTIKSARLQGNGVINIKGSGFGTMPATNEYVTIENAGNVYYSDSIISWTDTHIKVNKTTLPAIQGDIVTVITTNSGEASATIT